MAFTIFDDENNPLVRVLFMLSYGIVDYSYYQNCSISMCLFHI